MLRKIEAEKLWHSHRMKYHHERNKINDQCPFVKWKRDLTTPVCEVRKRKNRGQAFHELIENRDERTINIAALKDGEPAMRSNSHR